MRKLWVIEGILLLFLLTISDNAFSGSAENKGKCDLWCNQHKPRCEWCNSNSTCGGRDYVVLQSFTEGSGNWYACGKSSNHDRCKTWCYQNRSQCVICLSDRDCGGDKRMNIGSFTGPGDNWYACADAPNFMLCHDYCQKIRAASQNPNSCSCSTKKNCGSGWKNIESFTQRSGPKWYACEKR